MGILARIRRSRKTPAERADEAMLRTAHMAALVLARCAKAGDAA